jgi:hypothetical protein
MSWTTNVVPSAAICGTRYTTDGDAVLTIRPYRAYPLNGRNIVDQSGYVVSTLAITQYVNDTSEMINDPHPGWTNFIPSTLFSSAVVNRVSANELAFHVAIEGYHRWLNPPTNTVSERLEMQWYLTMKFDWANAWAILEAD